MPRVAFTVPNFAPVFPFLRVIQAYHGYQHESGPGD